MIFKFRGPLLRFTSYEREVEVDGATVEESLGGLCRAYPDLRPVLFDADGLPRRAHRFFLNGELLTIGDLTTPVSQSDSVEVLTAIAGG